ncbi:hypothetical protein Ndes2526B_g07415 [Nannochloris sp. 'desiccata']
MDESANPSRGLAASHSFNDFSMHTQQDIDDHHETHMSTTQPIDMREPAAKAPVRTSPFTVGSAPAGMAPISTSSALKIPRNSVASILLPSHSTGGTPRSSLELSWNSLPTPRHSMSDEPSSPKSPKSPTTPGGRRRKSQKIHGMDYYEFCELVRAGSL